MYDVYICVPRALTLMLVCIMHISMILDSCMYDARMVHASMMRNFSVTEGPTEKVILGDAYIHDACIHDACKIHA